MRLLLFPARTGLAQQLRTGGYAVDVEQDSAAAVELLEIEAYDLAIIDVGASELEDVRLIQDARARKPALPILALAQSGSSQERASALDAGCDDVLPPGFQKEELLATVRALLRRAQETREPVVKCGDLLLDPAARSVWLGQRPVSLTGKEFSLLEYLMRRCGQVVSQEELLAHCWDALVEPLTNVVRVHVNRLRRALGDRAGDSRII